MSGHDSRGRMIVRLHKKDRLLARRLLGEGVSLPDGWEIVGTVQPERGRWISALIRTPGGAWIAARDVPARKIDGATRREEDEKNDER